MSCEVLRPWPQRPTEGELFFNVELSPMASPGFEVGRPSPVATEVARMLERCLKESRAVETESLCIIAGEKVCHLSHVANPTFLGCVYFRCRRMYVREIEACITWRVSRKVWTLCPGMVDTRGHPCVGSLWQHH